MCKPVGEGFSIFTLPGRSRMHDERLRGREEVGRKPRACSMRRRSVSERRWVRPADLTQEGLREHGAGLRPQAGRGTKAKHEER